jgi:hypothetical protein
MKAIVQEARGTPNAPEHHARLARITGLLYLLLAVCGMFAPIVLEALVVPGDAASTARNIADARWMFGASLVTWIVIVVIDIALSVTLYLLLEPVSRALSLVTAAIRIVYSAILGTILLNLFDALRLLTNTVWETGLDTQQRQTMALASLDTFSAGFLLALVFFGVHLLALGCLFYRSRYVPRVFGMLLVAAGAGYIADSLASFFVSGYGGLWSVIFLVPVVVGELGLTVWLLVKGVKVRQVTVVETPFSAHTAPVDASFEPVMGGTQ